MTNSKEKVAFNKLIIVAKRYSAALIKLAKNDDELKTFYQELASIQETLNLSQELNTFLLHPSFSKEEKKEILKTIFKNHISKNILNFMFILIDRNRIFAFKAIIHSLKDMINKKNNLLTITAISAIKIPADLTKELQQKLESIYDKQIEITQSIDENLIAGMVLKIGDKTIDGSIKTKLEKMKRALT